MGSRLRTNVEHIFDCFCEVSAPDGHNQQARVVQKLPDSYNEEEMLKQFSLFAFPSMSPCNNVQHFSFVLTSLDSKWTFGFCRQAPNCGTALVITSSLPWHEFFFKILNQIAELMQHPSDLKSFLDALHQREVPEPGTTLHITYGKAQHVYTCKSPNTYALPSIPENRNLTEYFNAVDAQNMMIIFASMLHERRIVMVSSRISRLSACIQAANSVIYPMIWQHIYIPVLPTHLIDYLHAPMPYLAGVPSLMWERVRKSELGEMVVLNVDTNQIETPFKDLESLPADIVSSMKRRLRTPNHMMGDGVARVFLRALVQLIGGYRDALRFRQGEQITFCRDAFLHSRSHSLRPFLESMLELQIFQQFIEERLEMLNCGQGFSDEFELEACLYSDNSSSRLKKQYKEWLSTMKKESGAIFKTVRNKANPAMRQVMKSMKEQSRLAKEKSRTACKDIRSRFKDLQVNKDVDDAGALRRSQDYLDKPRSAPSSPKFSSMKITGTLPASNTDKNLRRCRTSVTSHYHNDSCSPTITIDSSSDDSSTTEEDLQLAPLNLNLVDDMKEILDRFPVDMPPAVDRSRKPSVIHPIPLSPTSKPVLPTKARVPHQQLPLPPPRCRKRIASALPAPYTFKEPGELDLIRLDTQSPTSPIDEFDPLARSSPERVNHQMNPLYPLYFPKQVAEAQVLPVAPAAVFTAALAAGSNGAAPGAVGQSSGFTRFNPQSFNSDSGMMTFTRANLACPEFPSTTKSNDLMKSNWTTFE